MSDKFSSCHPLRKGLPHPNLGIMRDSIPLMCYLLFKNIKPKLNPDILNYGYNLESA